MGKAWLDFHGALTVGLCSLEPRDMNWLALLMTVACAASGAHAESSRPAPLHCDTCRAIAHVITAQLKAATTEPGSTYETKKGQTWLKETVYLEVLENVCRGERGNPEA